MNVPRAGKGEEREVQALTHELFDALGDIFDHFDFDSNQVLDENELRRALAKLHLPCTRRDVETLRIGGGGSLRPMAKSDFIKFCVLQELRLLRIFHTLDTNADDHMSFAEFQRGLAKLGWRLSEQEMRAVFDRLDIEPDGKLTYTEWRRLLTSTPPEGMEWVDVFHRFEVISADINGDNLLHLHRDQLAGGAWVGTDLCAGLLSGTISRTVTAPFERIKVQLQLTASRQSPAVAEVVAQIYRAGGLRAFFQGNLTNCFKVAPQSAVFFAATDVFKRTLPTRGDPTRVQLHSFLAGTLAGITSQFAIYPLEPLKTRMTVALPNQYASLLDCARQLVRQEGVVGLYRGITPSLLGCIPYAGTQRLVYDELQSIYTRYTPDERPRPLASFISGFVSSCVGMTMSYPFVVVRTNMHAQGMPHVLGDQQQRFRYQGLTDTSLNILRNQGVAGFFRGLGANLVKAAPAAAVTFALYDHIKDAMRQPVFASRSY